MPKRKVDKSARKSRKRKPDKNSRSRNKLISSSSVNRKYINRTMSRKSSISDFIKPFIGQPGYQLFSTNYGSEYAKNFTVTDVNKSGKTIKVILNFSKDVKTEHILVWTRSKIWKEKNHADDKWTHWYIGEHFIHDSKNLRI